MRHRQVGNIGRPELIGSRDIQTPQQISVFLMLLVWDRSAGLRINRLQAHFVHQTGHPLVINCIAVLFSEPHCHFAVAVEGCPRIFLVNQAHQGQIEHCFASRLPVERRPVETDQVALPPDAKNRLLGFDQHTPHFNRTGQLFFSASQVPS
jgi:hypothetical protein